MQGEHRELLRIYSTNLGLNTWSGLRSVWYKEGLWKCSVGTNRNVVCLCDFLSLPIFSTEIGLLVKRHLCFLLSLQDWMSWFRTHKCNFNFDCLLVYFMHLLLEEGEQDFKRTFWGQSWHLTWYIPQEHGKQKHLFILGDLNSKGTHLQLYLHINTDLFLSLFLFSLSHEMKS